MAQNIETKSTFESISLSWNPANGDANLECLVRFRPAGSPTWKEGLSLWYDERSGGEYRGSLVKLLPNTSYEIELELKNTATSSTATVKTWSEEFPIVDTVYLPEFQTFPYTIRESGTENGYVLYTHLPNKAAVINVDFQKNNCIEFGEDVHHVILRGLTLIGANEAGIKSFSSKPIHDIVIEECEIYDFGTDDNLEPYGIKLRGATTERVIIQRNKIHHPKIGSISWRIDHPNFSTAIGFLQTGGNHVVRYNNIYSEFGKYFNDGIGGGQNGGYEGSPGADSDIYGNHITHVWDDAIEAEGGGQNVRIWGNYMDSTLQKIALVTVSIGPIYVWRNIGASSRRDDDKSDSDLYGRGVFIKAGTKKNEPEFNGGKAYIFHNTVLQPPAAIGKEQTLGSRISISASSRELINYVSRNNIFTTSKFSFNTIDDNDGNFSNDFDWDLYNGDLSELLCNGVCEPNGIFLGAGVQPIYDPLNGDGEFALAAGSLGVDAGIVIPNFNDDFNGTAPDMGAFERGQAPMEFGINAYLNSSGLRISTLSNVSVEANDRPQPISVQVKRNSTTPLTIQVTSSDPTLYSDSNITKDQTNDDFLISFNSDFVTVGNVKLTVEVSDGINTVTEDFLVFIEPFNNPPNISNIADQVINEDETLGPIGVIVNDAETAIADLEIEAFGINSNLIKSATLTGSGSNKSLTVVPQPHAFGESIIKINVSDGIKESEESFTLTVNSVNDAPSISVINDVTIQQNSSSPKIYFTIKDVESPSSSLQILPPTSTNSDVIDPSQITFGQESSESRWLVVNAIDSDEGIADITIKVSDGDDEYSEAFRVSVVRNNPPVISAIADQKMDINQTLGPIAFTVTDIETNDTNLEVTATSSDQSLIANSNISIQRLGTSQRELTLSPETNKQGSAQITLSTNDGQLTTTRVFTVNVGDNQAPTISTLVNQEIDEDQALTYTFFINDDQTSVANLQLNIISLDQSIIASDFFFSRNGSRVDLILSPIANTNGTAEIRIDLSDGLASTTSSFLVNVLPINDAPVLSPVAQKFVDAGAVSQAFKIDVADIDTPFENLILEASSSSLNLIKNENLVIERKNGFFNITVQSQPNVDGLVTINLSLDDGNEKDFESFEVLILKAGNNPPVINEIPDQITNKNQVLGPLAVNIQDIDSDLGTVSLSGTSSDQSKVVDGNIIISAGSTPSERILSITPSTGKIGNLVITLTAKDDSGDSTQRRFNLEIAENANGPEISAIPDQEVLEDQLLPAYSFQLQGFPNPAAVKLEFISSNPVLFDESLDIVILGERQNRSIILRPRPNQHGESTISIIAKDGINTASISFKVTVIPVNDIPFIETLPEAFREVNTAPTPIEFQIGDIETGSTSLLVTAEHDNPELIASLELSGTDENRSILVTPFDNKVGESTIILTVDDGDAKVTTSFKFTVNNPGEIEIPKEQLKYRKMLSPNGDGFNDLWIIENLDNLFTDYQLSIYNRHGFEVFESNNYQNSWDARQAGQPLSEGTYYFIIKDQTADFTVSGHILVIR